MMKKLAFVSSILLAISSITIAATPAVNQAQDSGNRQSLDRPLMRHDRPFHGQPRPNHHGFHQHQGGFTPHNSPIISVHDLTKLKDDEHITLEGVIEKQVGKHDFIFTDSTGSVEVEINRRAWMGQNITPTDHVKLFGTVDKSWDTDQIEIYHVVKANN